MIKHYLRHDNAPNRFHWQVCAKDFEGITHRLPSFGRQGNSREQAAQQQDEARRTGDWKRVWSQPEHEKSIAAA